MSVFATSRVIAAPPHALFDLVADVESYPEFLPLWRDARIVSRNGNTYVTEQKVGLGETRVRFRTRTRLRRPIRIEVSSDDPLFHELFIRWDFRAVGAGSRVSVALTWEMASRPLQAGLDRVLSAAADSMMRAFETRAATLLDARRAPE